MNKAEFINAVSEAAGSSKSDATAHVEAMISVVTSALKGDNEVALVGFVTGVQTCALPIYSNCSFSSTFF